MKVLLKLKNINPEDLHDEACECKICRNLCRIMDIKVEYVDAGSKTLSLIYENPTALALAMDELRRIGHPVRFIVKTSKGKLYRRIKEGDWASQKLLREKNNYESA